MNINKRTVPRWFREFCLSEYPGLGTNLGYWRLFEFLALHAPRGDDFGHVTSQILLAHLEDKEAEQQEHNYSGIALLDGFSRDVAPLKYMRYSIHDARARVVYEVGWSDAMREAITRVLKTRPRNVERVYLFDGSRYTPRKAAQQDESDKARAFEKMQNAGCREAYNLLDYLNNLAKNRFTKMLQYYDETLAATHTMENGEHYRKMLFDIKDYAKPYYVPVNRSVRIFASGMTIQHLHKDLRRILCQDWHECDLASAHLAICAKLWDIAPVTHYLQQPDSNIWRTLCGSYGVPCTPDTKAILKKALYALVYGDSKRNITVYMRKHGMESAIFFANPVIHAVYAARQGMMAKIVHERGATDCWGRRITTTKVEDEKEKLDVKSILSQLSQSLEFALLYPAVELAMQNTGPNGFDIMLWQWDGFSIATNRKADMDLWKQRLAQAVRKRICELGVETRLEWLPPDSPPSPKVLESPKNLL